MTTHEDEKDQDRCIGIDCPGCEAGRRHYRETGCLVSDCPRDHGPVIPPGGEHEHEWMPTSSGPVHPSVPRRFCPECGAFDSPAYSPGENA